MKPVWPHVNMPTLIRLESMLDSLKIHLQKGPAQGQEQFWKDLTWNLATQSQNIVLMLIDELYKKGRENE
tara:strand:- start:400 stop:609 length:210 start_codon:yes stop_codon:yes gene_type:complete